MKKESFIGRTFHFCDGRNGIDILHGYGGCRAAETIMGLKALS